MTVVWLFFSGLASCLDGENQDILIAIKSTSSQQKTGPFPVWKPPILCFVTLNLDCLMSVRTLYKISASLNLANGLVYSCVINRMSCKTCFLTYRNLQDNTMTYTSHHVLEWRSKQMIPAYLLQPCLISTFCPLIPSKYNGLA